MKWKFNLAFILRNILVCCLFIFNVQSAQAFVDPALMPVIPPTCSSSFWSVLKDRAWEEGQREITQNNNLIARPDSVLALSCFNNSLNHLGSYSRSNFPGDPDVSAGKKLFGLNFTDLIVKADQLVYSLPAPGILGTDGFLMHAVLELLVLDQLVYATDNLAKIADIAGMLPCTGKDYYIADNFPSRMLGDRDSANSTSLDDCSLMNKVWRSAKCYNFMSEPSHDGFYTFSNYATSNDYRTKDNQCPSPPANGAPSLPSIVTLACAAKVHNLPTFNPVAFAALFFGNTVPTWASAFDGSNPLSGSAGGVDSYLHFLGLRDSSHCSALTPIKTGYIVKQGSNTYVDAVCPAPGCYFNPPATKAGNGSCN